MKYLVVVLLSLLSLNLSAADRNRAYELICKNLPFETARRDCATKLKNFSYFDDRALNFCSSLTFDSNKLSCLDIIGDKLYEDYEIQSCLSEVFESRKIDCLKASGTRYNPNPSTCVANDEMIHHLQIGLRELRSGRSQAADRVMSSLLLRLRACPQY